MKVDIGDIVKVGIGSDFHYGYIESTDSGFPNYLPNYVKVSGIGDAIEIDKVEKVKAGEVIELDYTEITPLSTQLSRITGDSWTAKNFSSLGGDEPDSDELFIHTKSRVRFKTPSKLWNKIDGYNLYVEDELIKTAKTNKPIASVKDGELDFSILADGIYIDKGEVKKKYLSGEIPFNTSDKIRSIIGVSPKEDRAEVEALASDVIKATVEEDGSLITFDSISDIVDNGREWLVDFDVTVKSDETVSKEVISLTINDMHEVLSGGDFDSPEYFELGGELDDSKYESYRDDVIRHSEYFEAGNGYNSSFDGATNKDGHKTNGEYIIEDNNIFWVYTDGKGEEYSSNEQPNFRVDFGSLVVKENYKEGGSINSKFIDYVLKFYGKQGDSQDKKKLFGSGIEAYEVEEAEKELRSKNNWGDGDSLDRKRARDLILENRIKRLEELIKADDKDIKEHSSIVGGKTPKEIKELAKKTVESLESERLNQAIMGQGVDAVAQEKKGKDVYDNTFYHWHNISFEGDEDVYAYPTPKGTIVYGEDVSGEREKPFGTNFSKSPFYLETQPDEEYDFDSLEESKNKALEIIEEKGLNEKGSKKDLKKADKSKYDLFINGKTWHYGVNIKDGKVDYDTFKGKDLEFKSSKKGIEVSKLPKSIRSKVEDYLSKDGNSGDDNKEVLEEIEIQLEVLTDLKNDLNPKSKDDKDVLEEIEIQLEVLTDLKNDLK